MRRRKKSAEAAKNRVLSPFLIMIGSQRTLQEDGCLRSSNPGECKETTREDTIILRSRESNVQHHDHQEMWLTPLTICRLIVSEIEGLNWVNEKASKLVDFDGIIGEELVSNILDQLLEETITTLSLISKV